VCCDPGQRPKPKAKKTKYARAWSSEVREKVII
jgi:hypothetical protein